MNWNRLGIATVEVSDTSDLLWLAGALKRMDMPTARVRNDAAWWLEQLARNEKALATLRSSGRPGRKRDSKAPWIALDYLVQKELLGKAAAAAEDVRRAWRLRNVQTVKNAWKDWKTGATYQFSTLSHCAARYAERAQFLADVSADLREHHLERGTRKAR
jgi:hypothetical protein